MTTLAVLLLETLWSTRQNNRLLDIPEIPVLRLRETPLPRTLPQGTALEADRPLTTKALYLTPVCVFLVPWLKRMTLWQAIPLFRPETDPDITAEEAPGVRRTTPVFVLRRRFPFVNVTERATLCVFLFPRTIVGHPTASPELTPLLTYLTAVPDL